MKDGYNPTTLFYHGTNVMLLRLFNYLPHNRNRNPDCTVLHKRGTTKHNNPPGLPVFFIGVVVCCFPNKPHRDEPSRVFLLAVSIFSPKSRGVTHTDNCCLTPFHNPSSLIQVDESLYNSRANSLSRNVADSGGTRASNI